MKIARIAAVLPLVMALSGCGTVCNLACLHSENSTLTVKPPEVYGGVENDANCVKSGKPAGWGGVLVIADCLLSGVADTLTLPLTLWIESVQEEESRQLTHPE
jgi:uncharacterized protein YceK